MSFFVRGCLGVVLTLQLTTASLAADTVRLSRLAAASGYTYQWAAAEGGVTLARRGVVIVLHAGYPIYEVNAMPMQADSEPRLERGDLVISRALAASLRRIAINHPQTGDSLAPSRGSTNDSTQASISGALTLKVRQLPGRDSLALSGMAPANVPVTITLRGELSKDLPITVLSRTTVMSDRDGAYAAVAGIGQDTHRGSAIAATATSLAGIASAVTRIIVEAPSPRVNSTLDEFPPK